MRLVTLYLPLPLGLAALLFLVLAYRAISAPLEIEQVVAQETLAQEVSFDYSAIPKVSSLYPTATALGRQPTYLVNLTDRFDIKVQGKVTAAAGQQIEGTHEVIMRLQAGELWTKDYVLSPKQPFTGSGEFIALDLQTKLPFAELLAFSAQVAEEAKTGPSSFLVSLLPHIQAQVVGDTPGLVNTFAPCFGFELTTLQLTPKGVPRDRYSDANDATQDLVQQQAVSRPIVETVPNQINLLNAQLTVPAAKVLYSCVALMFLYLTCWLGLKNLRRRPQLSEVELINKRHGSRIIEVKHGAFAANQQLLQLGSFQSLLTLADDREKSILHTTDIDGLPSNHIYYLMDEGITYAYCIPESPEAKC